MTVFAGRWRSASRLCYTANSRKVEQKLNVLSVDEKAVRMAKRISDGMRTHELQASARESAENSADVISEPRQLRSGKTVEGSGIARVNNNYIVRLNRKADSMEEVPVLQKTSRDMRAIARWVAFVNKAIKDQIKARAHNAKISRARRRRALRVS